MLRALTIQFLARGKILEEIADIALILGPANIFVYPFQNYIAMW